MKPRSGVRILIFSLLFMPIIASAQQGRGAPPPDSPVGSEEENTTDEVTAGEVATDEVAAEEEAPSSEAPTPTFEQVDQNLNAVAEDGEGDVETPPEPVEPEALTEEHREISLDLPPTEDEEEVEGGDEGDEVEGADEGEGGNDRASRFRRFLQRIGIGFHGYSRMPLNLHFRPRDGGGGGEDEGDASEEDSSYLEVRSPLIRDNDYYASGFEYLRLAETDWTEMFLTVGTEDLEVTVGLFASLLSDWSHLELGTQFGIAQASLDWRNIAGLPLSLKAGVFWERLGYIEPYDTYLFGRTHWMGLRLGWDFPNGAMIRLGFGANKEWYERNVGMTPLITAYGGTPIGPVTLKAYVMYSFMNDIPAHQVDTWERGHLLVLGLDARVDFPWFDGPLYFAFAGYWAENSLYMGGVTELSHSWSGRGLTENYFGLESNDGTGRIFVGAVDWPVNIWRGLGLRFFGLMAHVWTEQEATLADPLTYESDEGEIFVRSMKVKWGLEPSYQILDWLRVSIQYHRVIPHTQFPTQAWRALSPEVRFTPLEDIHIRLQYIHYFYGMRENGEHLDDVQLRPGQALMVDRPDEDVIRIAAEATW